MEMIDEERLREDEYEQQYYGFNSTQLYQDFKELVSKAIKKSLKEVEAAFKEHNFNEVLQEQKISEIHALCLANADGPLERFKDEARKIFQIPKNVLLDEDEHNSQQYSDEFVLQLKKRVAELEKELLREKLFLAKCKQQKEFVDTVIKPMHEKVNHVIKSLKSLPEATKIDENEKKLLDLHNEHIRYYFNGEDTETDQPNLSDIKTQFIMKSNNFFNE